VLYSSRSEKFATIRTDFELGIDDSICVRIDSSSYASRQLYIIIIPRNELLLEKLWPSMMIITKNIIKSKASQ